MNRSGYCDDYDPDYPNALELFRANVDRATRGKRGQVFYRDLLAALDALPEKKLTHGELETEEGAVCALGALRVARGVQVSETIDEDDEPWHELGKVFRVAPLLTQEVMFENDDRGKRGETDEERWNRVRAWVAKQVSPAAPVPASTKSPAEEP